MKLQGPDHISKEILFLILDEADGRTGTYEAFEDPWIMRYGQRRDNHDRR